MELGWSKTALQAGQWKQEDMGAVFLRCLAVFCSKLCWQHKPFPGKAPPFPSASGRQQSQTCTLSNPGAKPCHWKPVIPQPRSGAGPRDRKASGIVTGKDLPVLEEGTSQLASRKGGVSITKHFKDQMQKHSLSNREQGDFSKEQLWLSWWSSLRLELLQQPKGREQHSTIRFAACSGQGFAKEAND